jgi:hypothetical protein
MQESRKCDEAKSWSPGMGKIVSAGLQGMQNTIKEVLH